MEAYVTLATTDSYGIGALVLGHSLLSQGTSRQLCILVTPGVSEAIRTALAQVYHNVVCVDVLDSNDTAHLALMARPELGVTFTKLHCWTLTQYSKCVFLDADILALQNTDELFSQPELSAACDVGWPDCFNSGMFVFVPSQETYARLLEFAKNTGSFDGGDQGLLNSFFPTWNRLSFVYNMVASAAYTYLPAFKQFGRGVKFVHFLGSAKPWHGEVTTSSIPGASTYESFVQAWWTIYRQLVLPTLPGARSPPPRSPSPQHQPQSGQPEPVAFQCSDTEHSKAAEDTSEVMTKTVGDSSELTQHLAEGHHDKQTQTDFVVTIDSIVDKAVSDSAVECPTASSEGETLVDKQDCESFSATGQPTRLLNIVSTMDDNEESGSTLTSFYKSRSMPSSEKHTPSSSPPRNLKESSSCHSVELAQQLSSVNLTENLRESRQRWEAGRPDYMGRDSVDNILSYIDSKIKK